MNKFKEPLKKHFRKRWKAYTVISILLAPIVLTLIFSAYLLGGANSIAGEIVKFKNNLTVEAEDFPKLSEIINYLISAYTLIATVVFSWAVLQSSIKSNILAEEIKNREDNKDYELVRESALIVYYDLLLGVKDLMSLYVSKIINKGNPIPRKIYFSNDWIKNVAILKNNLSAREISDIYSLYGRFLTIASLLDEGQVSSNYSNVLDEEISNLVDEVYSSIFPKAFLKNYRDTTEKLLNRKYYLLIEKLRSLTYKKDQHRIEKDTEVITADIYLGNGKIYSGGYDEDTLNGNGEYYLLNGKSKFEGYFKDGYFISGIAREFYSNGSIMYEVTYKDNSKVSGKLFYLEDTKQFGGKLCYDGKFKDNNIIDGFAEQYFDNFNILYRGYLADGRYEGNGAEYYNDKNISVEYEGIWKRGVIQNGEFFGKGEGGVKYFKGKFKHSQPYNGYIKYGGSYINDYINAFEGEIRQGKVYDGKGKVMFLNSFGNDYRDISILIREDAEDHHDYYDNEIDLEWERKQKQHSFDQIKSKYSEWEEFIDAEWKSGEMKLKENDILHKEIFYKTYSEIKNNQ
jgi:antitoxin component YwqK of YwqJK toxin-antitoxin module